MMTDAEWLLGVVVGLCVGRFSWSLVVFVVGVALVVNAVVVVVVVLVVVLIAVLADALVASSQFLDWISESSYFQVFLTYCI